MSAPRGATDPVVSVRGLTKSYGGRRVVDGLDLDVHAGEVVGLIGTNGAGKTTAVECLQGLRTPDAGHVRVLGLDPQRDADRLRPQIGSQLQDSSLPDRLRVAEAIDLFAGSQAAAGDRLLEQFGLAHRRRSPFGGMSGGERQRLFLVLALLNRPRLVILDELTQGLDPAARRDVWTAVAQLRDAGTTVLLVTHELSEAEALCERVVVMRDGRILDQGTPAELVARHAATATVRFGLGSPGPRSSGSRSSDPRSFGVSGSSGEDALLDELRRLPGVRAVEHAHGRVTVVGERRVIAHVGAWLVERPETVPADLHVEVPDLEAALLRMLDEGDPAANPIAGPDPLDGPAPIADVGPIDGHPPIDGPAPVGGPPPERSPVQGADGRTDEPIRSTEP